ncbi:MAG: (Fe-S)-binding protein [Chloroflexi bacterium]|nr:(Fe-S)-binding protein [Chloroflexota bacterium]
MLTLLERIAFVLLVLVTLGWAGYNFWLIARAIRRGHGEFPWREYLKTWQARIRAQIVQVGLNYPVFQNRPRVGLLHFMVFAGFSFYFLVNVVDFVEGYFGFTTLHQGGVFALFNLAADLLSIGVLVGMSALLVRRFIVKDKAFNIRENVLLDPRVRAGAIRRDSLIVGLFILIHVGSRWLGSAFRLGQTGQPDWSAPGANVVAMAFANLPEPVLTLGAHVTWWTAIGLIFLFFPYFVLSKHIHIFFAPLNWLVFRERKLEVTEPAKQNGKEGVGAQTLQELSWHSILDSYACIMCNRCQDICPAYAAGTALSPSALEINKRYWLNENLRAFSGGAASPSLLDFAITKEAVWACTTCGACVEVCPVGNAPMVDIIEIRRALINEADTLDANLQKALENLGKQGNSFGQSARNRVKWTQGLNFKIQDARKEEVEHLWFVGDYAAYDPRGQALTRQVAQVFQDAGLDFGTLYEAEWNTGNDARRAGEEGLFEQLAEHNIAALDKAKFRSGIITTDPHTMNALRFEYAKLGKQYTVTHYTQVLMQLIAQQKIAFKRKLNYRVTYHDPCYLGRYNQVTQQPRQLLQALGVELIEMPRHGMTSFCCGAGGGQIWKGGAVPGERPSEQRIREALSVLSSSNGNGNSPASPLLFVVACPKDVAMYSDAVKTSGNDGKIVVKDIIELVAEALQEPILVTPDKTPLTQADADARAREAELA